MKVATLMRSMTLSALAVVSGSVPTASMQASAPRLQILISLVDILFLEIEEGPPRRLGKRHPLGHRIHSDHALGAEQKSAADCELPDGAAAPDGNGVTFLDVAEICCHIGGRKDIGEKQDLFVREAVRHLDGPDIGERHPKIFGLSAREAAQHV